MASPQRVAGDLLQILDVVTGAGCTALDDVSDAVRMESVLRDASCLVDSSEQVVGPHSRGFLPVLDRPDWVGVEVCAACYPDLSAFCLLISF